MKALPTRDSSDKILCKLFSVLEVCFCLCMQKRQGLFREASRVRLRKRCGKIKFYSEKKTVKDVIFLFSTLAGYPLQGKDIQHAQTDHPTSLAANLTWMRVLHIL